MLRFEMAPILQRWNALKRGLYMKPFERVTKEQALPWLLSRIGEILNMTKAFEELMNVEFARSWGEPGEPGSDTEIVTACRLFSEMCTSALQWEETVRFAKVEAPFEEVHRLHIGAAGGLIDEAAKLPAFLAEHLINPEPGEYRLSLTLTLPDGWNDAIEEALESAARELGGEFYSQ